MKKILGKTGSRKQFNSDTAEVMASITRGTGPRKTRETLYKTPRGDFFIMGHGGPLTRWGGRTNIIEIEGAALEFWKEKAGLR